MSAQRAGQMYRKDNRNGFEPRTICYVTPCMLHYAMVWQTLRYDVARSLNKPVFCDKVVNRNWLARSLEWGFSVQNWVVLSLIASLVLCIGLSLGSSKSVGQGLSFMK